MNAPENTAHNNHDMRPLPVAGAPGYPSLDNLTAGLRFERLIECVHALGPRPLGELLIEIASHTGQSSFIAHRLEEYARLDRDILRALGADRFPPMPLTVIR